MQLLKKDIVFIWDEVTQRSFDALNQALTTTPLVNPPNYNKDFLLYLVPYETTIGMVFVQIDDNQNEDIIYYLNKGLVDVELRYPYIEKLTLVAVLIVQIFQHYILLRTTTVIFYTNLMQYILSRQTHGGKYSKWIVILQEFYLEFNIAKSKKSLVFVELMTNLPQVDHDITTQDSLPDESLFLIDSFDLWYRYILIYLQTQNFRP